MPIAAGVVSRVEPGVIAGITVHAASVWAFADGGIWVWSVTGILAMLGALAVAGLMRPVGASWRLVRGGLGLCVLLLVGQLAGAVPGPLEFWFGLLAFAYPLVLSAGRASLVPLVVAGSYAAALRLADPPAGVTAVVVRSLVVFGVGAAACVLGRVLRQGRGEEAPEATGPREAEGRLRAAFDTAASGMALLALNGKVLMVNQAACDLLGRPREWLMGSDWHQLLHPEDLPEHAAALERLVAGDVWSFQQERRFRLRDDRVIWAVVGSSLVHDAAARPRYLFVTVTNITDRARAESRLQLSEAHLRNLFDSSPVPLWETDLSAVVPLFGRWHADRVSDLVSFLGSRPDQCQLAVSAAVVRRANAAACALFAATGAEELSRAAAAGTLGRGYREAVIAQLDSLWRGTAHRELPLTLTDLRGTFHSGVIRLVVPTVGGRPDASSVVVSFADLTEDLQARDQLRRVEDRLRTVMAAAPIVVFAVDEHGVFTFSEGQGLAALGLSPGEAVGRSVFEMYREYPEVIRAMRRALDGDTFRAAVKMGDLVFDTRYSAMWEEGRVVGVIGVANDITEQTRAADRLRQLIRAKDEFVATVSHELRTPLTAVVGFSRELRDRFDRLGPDEVRGFIELIGEQATEVADLVEDLLVASRLEAEEVAVTREAIHLWDQVDAVLDARRQGKEVTAVRHEDDAKVFADPMRVRQVFRNLLANADRYGGPHVTVRVDRLGETYALSVIDDGGGIPEGERERIFEPYFRARQDVGTAESVGLGLTVSRQLARLMNGDLRYDYRGGHSIFTVTLPAA